MITELKPTNLIAVEVKTNACNYRIVRKSLFFNETDEPAVPRTLELQNNCKILGEVTKDKIGFDVEPYVDSYEWEDSTTDGLKLAYRDYKDGKETDDYWDMYPFDEPRESFYSLLAANGLYFENPVKVSGKHIVGTINKLTHDWQYFEEKLIRGKLLILEKL